MLDQIYSAFSRWYDLDHEGGVSGPLFASQRYVHPGSKKAFIILDPWHVSPALFYFVKRKIRKSASSYIHYSFAPEILTADVESTRDRFKKFSRQIRNELEVFSKKTGITQCTVIGISLSCVTASLIASHNPLVHEVIMVVPGHSLAESMWYGLRTSSLRRTMEKNGVRLAELQRQWANLAPEYYLSKLADKKIRIFISKTDRIIPAYCGRKYSNAARKIIPSVNVVENRWLGHYASILYYCNFSKVVRA